MRTYKIGNIIAKGQRVGGRYLELCQDLATEWNEDTGLATFDDDALEEIRQLAPPAKTAPNPCHNCRGLSND
jgi:hypothetical protein